MQLSQKSPSDLLVVTEVLIVFSGPNDCFIGLVFLLGRTYNYVLFAEPAIEQIPKVLNVVLFQIGKNNRFIIADLTPPLSNGLILGRTASSSTCPEFTLGVLLLHDFHLKISFHNSRYDRD